MNAAVHDVATGFRPANGGLVERVGRLAAQWRERARERQALAALDGRDLHDLGLSRWEVDNELMKPLWRG